MSVVVTMAVAVSGGGAVAVAVAGLTKRFFNHIQKDFLITFWQSFTLIGAMFAGICCTLGCNHPNGGPHWDAHWDAASQWKMQSFHNAFFSIFGGGAQHAAKNRKKCKVFVNCFVKFEL